eukprot:TRINITY_DN8497_c0_g1_i2.p1 TRINITY_DN8497_c0_g1~~TRINITY_DN8497_c0_g1_i2.p1  ORF type:complete len:621 (-),score=90.39 TRINITY_DN8497_c0_g1_i2:66-1895(-)
MATLLGRLGELPSADKLQAGESREDYAPSVPRSPSPSFSNGRKAASFVAAAQLAVPPAVSESDLLKQAIDIRLAKHEEQMQLLLSEMHSSLARGQQDILDLIGGSQEEQTNGHESLSVDFHHSDACSQSDSVRPKRPSTTSVTAAEAEHRQKAQRMSMADDQSCRRARSSVWDISAHVESSTTRWLRCLSARKEFDIAVNVIVILNMVLIGAEVDYSATVATNKIPHAFRVLNYLFALFFVLEVTVRCIATGCRGFFCSPEAPWHMVDAVAACAAISEVFFELLVSRVADGLNVNVMAVLRILQLGRLLRGVKLFRYLRYISSLQTMLVAIADTTRFLLWTFLLVMFVTFLWGVALTRLVSENCRVLAVQDTGDADALPACKQEDVRRYWARLSASMYTLFKCMTGGITWDDLLDDLGEVSSAASILFVFYICFTFFVLLNVLTGVFCTSSIESAHAQKDVAAMRQMQNHQKYADSIKKIFTNIDLNGSALISLQEFENALEEPEMSALLESMNIPTSDAWMLFRMIDFNQDGAIDLDEFVDGCMHLRGNARAIQLAKISMENKIIRQDISETNDMLMSLLNQHGAVWRSRRRSRIPTTDDRPEGLGLA